MLVVAAGIGVEFLLIPPREDMEAGIRVEDRYIEG
jgi:hypothetical protein